MTRIIKTILFVTAVTAMSLAVFPVAAQIETIDSGVCQEFGIPCSGNEDQRSLVDYIWTVVDVFLVVAAITAAVFLVIGGVRYVTSRGEEEATVKAKNTILYAVIGLIIIGLSGVIVNFIVQVIEQT